MREVRPEPDEGFDNHTDSCVNSLQTDRPVVRFSVATTSPPDRLTGRRSKEQSGRTTREQVAGDAEPEEAELLLSYLANGDSTAFWRLWGRYQKYLYNLCLRQMGGVKVDAEDALSRAMLKARDKLPYYAGSITDVRAWLGRLISNLCIDIHREQNRRTRGTISLEEMLAFDNESMPSNLESPEQVFLANEMFAYVRQAIEDLPPRLREPYLLRSSQQISYRDIATQLALSSDNARKRVQQARAILRERIGSYLRGFERETMPPQPSMGSYGNRGRLPGTPKPEATT